MLTIHPSWDIVLGDVEDTIDTIGSRVVEGLKENPRTNAICPPPIDVFNAFSRPIDEVKVVIIGQDPYPTPGHAMGLSFSVRPDVKPLPRSLANIFTEMVDDLGCAYPTTGDLTPWADQGVLLLNRVLTTYVNRTAAHLDWGWQTVTNHVVSELAARNQPMVFVLWGRKAQEVKPLCGAKPVICSAHPSPFSARNGFFGSKPFSRINDLLIQQGAAPITWELS